MQESKAGRELTLAIIKPDAVAAGHAGRIVSELVRDGFVIRDCLETRLCEEAAAEFYADHEGGLFYGELVSFMSSGRVIVLALEREHAVAALRRRIGATDPARARPGTIRSEFGTRMPENAIHGSDSISAAKAELLYFFGEARGAND